MVDYKKALKGAGAKRVVRKPLKGRKPVPKKVAVKEKKERTVLKEGERKPNRRSKRTNILTGPFKPAHTVRVCKQVFLGNLPTNAGVPEIMELLRRFRHKIERVRLVRSSGAGKKAVREAGKVVPRPRGAAFVKVTSVSIRDQLLKLKNLSLGGKKIRVEKAKVKKAHIAKMAAQTKLKKENYLKRKEVLTAKKAVMAENRLKNIKHEKNVKKRQQKKKASKTTGPKPLTEAAKRKMSKIRVPRQERAKLSGRKAQKARARMSRK